MYRILAAVASISIATASIAGPAVAAPKFGSHSGGIASFVHGLLNFRVFPQNPPKPPPHMPPQAVIGVCNILKVDWLVAACRSGFPGGGMSPG